MQFPGLFKSARKSIQNESTATMQATAAFANHLPHCGVRHQSTAAHLLHRVRHGRRVRTLWPADSRAEGVAG